MWRSEKLSIWQRQRLTCLWAEQVTWLLRDQRIRWHSDFSSLKGDSVYRICAVNGFLSGCEETHREVQIRRMWSQSKNILAKCRWGQAGVVTTQNSREEAESDLNKNDQVCSVCDIVNQEVLAGLPFLLKYILKIFRYLLMLFECLFSLVIW